MSNKNKLQRFAELYTLPNVYQNPSLAEPHLIATGGIKVERKGTWHEHFHNEHPITLELACGKAEYTLALAQAYPERNFIAIDLKGNRLWKGATSAIERGLNNAAFVRTQIELIGNFFAPNEVSEIWITFPDPYLRASKAKKRLTSPRFLALYRRFLKPDGIIHLKTDDDTLYEFTLETIAENPDIELIYTSADIYAAELAYPELNYKTYYEGLHLAADKKIKYVRFRFKS